MAIFLLFDAATAIVVLPRRPALLIERSGRQPGTEGWDKFIMPIAAGLAGVVLHVVPAAQEDMFLMAALSGYQEYALRVKYRLLPGIW